MSASGPLPTTTPPSSGRSRGRLVLAVLVALPCLWWAWRWTTTPRVPDLPLDGVDPEVAALVRSQVEVLRGDPRSAEQWGRLGMILLANQFEQKAVAIFARAESLNPTDPRWPYLCGIAQVGRDPGAALPCFRRAAECAIEDRGAAARLRLAETLAAEGRNDEAAAEYRKVPPGPLAPCVDYGLGALAAARGDREIALKHLARCEESPYTRRKTAARMAALARLKGEPPASNSRTGGTEDVPWPDPFLAECLQLATGKESRMRAVAALERQGKTAQALEALRQAARDYPDASTLLALGITCGRQGYFEESEAALRRCLELQPDLVRAQYYLSLALYGQGEVLKGKPGRDTEGKARFEEAAAWARRATATDPGHGEAHLQLGLCLLGLERPAEAIAAFRRAVSTRPDLADSHLWLGKTLAETGQREEGLRHLRNAVRVAGPDDPRAQRTLDLVLAGKAP